MNLLNSDGEEYSIRVAEYTCKKMGGKSSLHLAAYEVLHELFPFENILQEIPARCGDKLLYLDLLVPSIKLGVECHGRQHYEFNPHFHKNIFEFYKAVRRDKMKTEWAEVNGIDLITIRFDEDPQERITAYVEGVNKVLD